MSSIFIFSNTLLSFHSCELRQIMIITLKLQVSMKFCNEVNYIIIGNLILVFLFLMLKDVQSSNSSVDQENE